MHSVSLSEPLLDLFTRPRGLVFFGRSISVGEAKGQEDGGGAGNVVDEDNYGQTHDILFTPPSPECTTPSPGCGSAGHTVQIKTPHNEQQACHFTEPLLELSTQNR